MPPWMCYMYRLEAYRYKSFYIWCGLTSNKCLLVNRQQFQNNIYFVCFWQVLSTDSKFTIVMIGYERRTKKNQIINSLSSRSVVDVVLFLLFTPFCNLFETKKKSSRDKMLCARRVRERETTFKLELYLSSGISSIYKNV